MVTVKFAKKQPSPTPFQQIPVGAFFTTETYGGDKRLYFKAAPALATRVVNGNVEGVFSTNPKAWTGCYNMQEVDVVITVKDKK